MIEAERADERDFEAEKAALEAKHDEELRERKEEYDKSTQELKAKLAALERKYKEEKQNAQEQTAEREQAFAQ